jgi:hypothetical protein
MSLNCAADIWRRELGKILASDTKRKKSADIERGFTHFFGIPAVTTDGVYTKLLWRGRRRSLDLASSYASRDVYVSTGCSARDLSMTAGSIRLRATKLTWPER